MEIRWKLWKNISGICPVHFQLWNRQSCLMWILARRPDFSDVDRQLPNAAQCRECLCSRSLYSAAMAVSLPRLRIT